MEPRPKFILRSGLRSLRCSCLFLLRPDSSTSASCSVQGEGGGLTFPMRVVSTYWFPRTVPAAGVANIWGSFSRSIVLGLMVMVTTVTVVGHGRAGVPHPVPRLGNPVLHLIHHRAGDPFLLEFFGRRAWLYPAKPA